MITRRRAIRILAAAAGLPLLPRRGRAEASLVGWRGTALGAVATLQIHDPDRTHAESLVERAVAEVRRLERLFSLQRPDSALVALNRAGRLARPDPDFVALLRACARFAALTGGAFDPTVQPLWELHRGHFARPGADPDGPSAPALTQARARVGFDGVAIRRDEVRLARSGMALTLNGIAQGYITDRVVDLLRAEGIERSLVDLGELRALGDHPEGRPWRVGIADPAGEGASGRSIPLVNRAVATSGPSAFRFDQGSRFNHLFDPATGRCADRYDSVSVVLPGATAADALSTAFTLMAPDAMRDALRSAGGGEVHLLAGGEWTIVVS